MTESGNSFLCFGKVAVASIALKWDDYWISVNGFWLEITKKVGSPYSFVIPLDLANLSTAANETSIQNSILITTSSITGSFTMYLTCTNRLDIIQLFHAVQQGQRLLQTILQNSKEEKTCAYEVESLSGLFNIGKTKLIMSCSLDGFEFTSKKGSQKYELNKIVGVYAKWNDSSAHFRLCIAYEDNGSTSVKEFNTPDHTSLLTTITTFLVNYGIIRKISQDSLSQ